MVGINIEKMFELPLSQLIKFLFHKQDGSPGSLCIKFTVISMRPPLIVLSAIICKGNAQQLSSGHTKPKWIRFSNSSFQL